MGENPYKSPVTTESGRRQHFFHIASLLAGTVLSVSTSLAVGGLVSRIVWGSYSPPPGTRHFNDAHDFEIGLVAGVGTMVTLLVITCVFARFVAIRSSVTT